MIHQIHIDSCHRNNSLDHMSCRRNHPKVGVQGYNHLEDCKCSCLKIIVNQCSFLCSRVDKRPIWHNMSDRFYLIWPRAAQAAWVKQIQSSGWLVETSAIGSKWRLQASVCSWASVAVEPDVMKRNVRIWKLTFCPNSVCSAFNLYWDSTLFPYFYLFFRDNLGK